LPQKDQFNTVQKCYAYVGVLYTNDCYLLKTEPANNCVKIMRVWCATVGELDVDNGDQAHFTAELGDRRAL